MTLLTIIIEKLVIRGERRLSIQNYDPRRPYEHAEESSLVEARCTEGTEEELIKAFRMLRGQVVMNLDDWEKDVHENRWHTTPLPPLSPEKGGRPPEEEQPTGEPVKQKITHLHRYAAKRLDAGLQTGEYAGLCRLIREAGGTNPKGADMLRRQIKLIPESALKEWMEEEGWTPDENQC